MVFTVLGLGASGFFIGVCSGLLGIGGGMVMVPILRLGFGLSAYSATATSLFSMLFTSASGTTTHIRNKTCIPKLGVALGAGGCLTSVAGVYLGNISPSWVIMLVAGIVIAYSGITMLQKALKLPRSSRAGAGTGPASQSCGAVASRDETFELTRAKLFAGIGIGMLAGLVAGYIGVGGGFIMVPLMTALLGVPMRQASGTSLIAIAILAIPGIVEQAYFGHIDYLFGLLMALGSIPGAAFGARFVKTIPEREMRLIFSAFLGLAAVLLVLNELGVM